MLNAAVAYAAFVTVALNTLIVVVSTSVKNFTSCCTPLAVDASVRFAPTCSKNSCSVPDCYHDCQLLFLPLSLPLLSC